MRKSFDSFLFTLRAFNYDTYGTKKYFKIVKHIAV